jgi:hypothetical protein
MNPQTIEQAGVLGLQILTIDDLDPMDEVFSWQDEVDGAEPMLFHVTKLAAHIEEVKRVDPKVIEQRTVITGIDKDFASFCFLHRGVEVAYLDKMIKRLSPGGTPLPSDLEPALMLEMDDGSHLLVDGTHRYCAYAATGRDEIKVITVPKAIWKFFVVEGGGDLAAATIPN